MKLSAIILILILFVFQATGQYKTVRIKIIDQPTKKPLGGVSASPVFTGDTVVSDEKGMLFHQVPKGFFDSITLTRADYHPTIMKVPHAPPGSIFTVPMKPLNGDSAYLIDNKQYRQADGLVYHYYQGKMLDSVAVGLGNNKILGYTDSKGEYIVSVPRANDSLYISLEGFRTMKVSSRHPGPYGLVPINPGDTEMRRVNWKNVLSVSPLELLRGGIGLRYERFVSKQHSVGLHTSYYFFNKTREVTWLSTSESEYRGPIIEEFDGIKLEPFYRYYLKKTVRGGKYFEVKPIAGYFYFPELIDYDHNPYYFWNFGISGAWGIMAVQNNKHLTLNFSIGIQYFPMGNYLINQHEYPDKGWWYVFGPGSALEIKLTLGDLF